MNIKKREYHVSEVADICGVSKETVRRWDNSGKLTALREDESDYRVYSMDQLLQFDEARLFFEGGGNQKAVKPKREFTLIELFAGAGGLALGLERCGFKSLLLNEIDKNACATLRKNRPDWNVAEGSITELCFKKYHNKVDLLTGGFPCQAFSYAGKKLGFEDIRGTMFFEFARCLKETNAKVFMAENVRGLLSHDNGRTLRTMIKILDDLGYFVEEPRIMKAIHHRVPQKRERLIIVGIRKDLRDGQHFEWPRPTGKIYTVRDALKAGELFKTDVPPSDGQKYPGSKQKVMELTDNKGVDVSIEAVGIPETLELCIDIVTAGGHIANIGVHGKSVLFHMENLWSHNITLTTRLVDTVSTPMLFKTVQSKKLDANQLITHHFTLDDIMKAYDTFENAAKEKALKVIITN
jgi:DNA (cytosine-5)-methyltransferase 1